MFFTFVFSGLIPLVVYLISVVISFKSSWSWSKMSPFECGFDPKESSRSPFSFRFFLMAVVFMVFDIELALVLPLPFIIFSFGWAPWMMLFFLILVGGAIYEWVEGCLDWMV
uniref:NADH dehydrogenase subunit 3 n=1 Tax=Laqueus japonicus TaxID=147651 RepID=UPI000EF30539|nr:NADH dehydrogenase subunit 3 [Laqueus japonicus]AYI69526.1 NADH dehydrogenase subunit 3 [Laqueus japonicus]